jgi:TRAP-type C4-dicarboxylate transport system substrate-binding protein
MKFNTLQFPESVVRKAAVTAAIDAEDALQKAKRQLRKNLRQHDVVVIHRQTRAKQDVARSLTQALREVR